MKTRSMRGASLGQDLSFIHPDYGTINPSEFQIHTSQPSVQCLVPLFILQTVLTVCFQGHPHGGGGMGILKAEVLSSTASRHSLHTSKLHPHPVSPTLSLDRHSIRGVRYVAQFAPLYLSLLHSEHIPPMGRERQQAQLQ